MKASLKIYLLLFMFCSFNLFGQDLIITNSKEELKTKVIEIEELLIKYKKFDFQDGPIYSIKKSEVFLIIYSNGTRETFNQNEVNRNEGVPPKTKNRQGSDNDINGITTQTINTGSSTNVSNAKSEEPPVIGFKRVLIQEGDKFLGFGIGTGVLLGNSGGMATVNIPYVSARFDKVYKEFGDNMAAGAGLFVAYHSYSIGAFANESIFNVISGGLSGSFYYNISEKLAVGAGLRLLYVSVSTSESYVYDIGSVADVNLYVLGSAYYNVAKKLNLFTELSTGLSNINVGVQIIL